VEKSILDISVSSLLILYAIAGFVLLVYHYLKLNLFKDLLTALLRMTLQLTIAGFILVYIFNINSFWLILIVFIFMASFAGHTTSELKRWLFFFVPAFGGLLSGFLVFKFAPEAEGHGTDAAIEAIHHKNGYIRWHVPIIKTIASALTIGTGGSGGREGPIAQIGAGFGSFLGRILHLTDREKRILAAAGMGAGIGAIFRSPLAGTKKKSHRFSSLVV